MSSDVAASLESQRYVRVYIEAFLEAAPLTDAWHNDGLWAHIELEATDIFGLDLADVHCIARTVRYPARRY